MSMKSIAGIVIVTTLITGVAQAAGTGTGVEAGFTEAGSTLDTLIEGAGGYLVIVISTFIAAVTWAIGKGPSAAIASFCVAMFLGYGTPALQGISGVTANTEMLLKQQEEPVPAQV